MGIFIRFNLTPRYLHLHYVQYLPTVYHILISLITLMYNYGRKATGGRERCEREREIGKGMEVGWKEKDREREFEFQC